MKKIIPALLTAIFLISNISSAQLIPEIKNLKSISLHERKDFTKINSIPSMGAGMGFNLGMAIIEDNIGFAVGAFGEIRAGGITFVPQANYWTASGQNNFELAGLARKYLGKNDLLPYIDGGLGVNFYKSDSTSFSKLSILIGGGVELDNVSSSFSLIFDAKYKLIINDPGNISCFIFTAGMKFPFK